MHCNPTWGSYGNQLAVNDHLPLKDAQEQFVAAYLKRLLARFDNDTQKVADSAGMHVTNVRRLIRKLGLKE
jgi:hypothetical protein